MSEILDFVLSNLMDYCDSNPREYTYFAIGSAPHLTIDKLDERWDQVIPKFVLDILDNTDLTVRLINIDPQFGSENIKQLMVDYHNSGKWKTTYKLDFEYDNSDGMQIWRTKDHRVESIIIAAPFDHLNRWNEKTNDWFIEKLVESTIRNNNKLVVQEYTGYELDQLRKELYHKSQNKIVFKKKIMIDMSYGNDCHCGTDLTKYKPYYDEFHDFINITLLSEDEMVKIIGKNPDIDKIIQKYFVGKFRKVVNNIHVDYRRRIKGEPVMYGNKLYNNQSSPDQVMQVLQDEICQILPIFEMLKLISHEKRELIHNLFQKYKEYDMYKWNSQVLSLFIN